MAHRIKIKKGLQIPLLGDSEEVIRGTVKSEFVRICPEDFHGITPKLAVRVDDTVKAGTALFYDKNHPDIRFASPVSGLGSKMGMDATNKWPGETQREWGRPMCMAPGVAQRMDALAQALGL